MACCSRTDAVVDVSFRCTIELDPAIKGLANSAHTSDPTFQKTNFHMRYSLKLMQSLGHSNNHTR